MIQAFTSAITQNNPAMRILYRCNFGHMLAYLQVKVAESEDFVIWIETSCSLLKLTHNPLPPTMCEQACFRATTFPPCVSVFPV
jgi:hypothetical protein